MQCRNCGTEIADKAIVCYRCGTATTDPVRRPVRVAPRRSSIVPIVLVVALVVVAGVFAQASGTAAEPQYYQLAAGLAGGAALAILLVRILKRR